MSWLTLNSGTYCHLLSPTVAYWRLLLPTVAYCRLLSPTVTYCHLLSLTGMYWHIFTYSDPFGGRRRRRNCGTWCAPLGQWAHKKCWILTLAIKRSFSKIAIQKSSEYLGYRAIKMLTISCSKNVIHFWMLWTYSNATMKFGDLVVFIWLLWSQMCSTMYEWILLSSMRSNELRDIQDVGDRASNYPIYFITRVRVISGISSSGTRVFTGSKMVH